MRKLTQKQFIPIILFFVMLSSCGIASLLNMSYHQEQVSVNEAKSLELKDILEIKIDTRIVHVNIESGDVEQLEINLHGQFSKNKDNLNELITEYENNILNISVYSEKNKFQIGDFVRAKAELNLIVPKEYNEKFSIKTESGNLNIRNLNVKRLNFYSDEGQIKIFNSTFERSSFFSSIGNIDINKSSLGKGEIKSETGEITANLSVLNEDIEVEQVEGSTHITLNSDSSFELEFVSFTGNFQSSFPMTIEEYSQPHEKKIIGKVADGKYKIYFATSTGNVNLDKKINQ